MQAWRWCIGVVAVILFLSGAAQAQTKLRYQFKAGDKLEYAMDQDMNMSMNVGGKDIEMKLTQQMDMHWNVQAVDDQGNAQIEMKMGRVKMAMKGPMGLVEVDSNEKKQPEDAVGKVFVQIVQALSDMQMTFLITETGAMKDVKISEKALKALQNLPGVDKLGGDMFSAEGMKRMVQGGLTLPTNAVKKGDDWTQKAEMKLPFGKTSGNIKYVYEGPTTKEGQTVEQISFKPDLKIDTDPNSPFQIKVKDQEGKGVVYFDNQAGRMTALSSEMTMNMAIEVQNMAIAQRIVQVSSLRLKGPSTRQDATPR